jgi:2-oxoglutarate ferredoxin oxidoreductase subunit beta
VKATLTLEQGKPLVFGTPEGRKGIVVKNGSPSVIDLAAGDDPVAKGVVVHDEKIDSSSYAGMLATLQRPEFPVPIGVFRSPSSGRPTRTCSRPRSTRRSPSAAGAT